ncbi:hypothetical protein [Chondrinema litorale]|uniref:hypothetical protein n=1 Tax=Chondrinema litorale TaxID=2994555 RepID=UPI002542EB4A|nr:hypothetical protein [Chondrinema litorale]UZR98439.1 hypothetical protein OQ292_31870 [Chondrinema litorale]
MNYSKNLFSLLAFSLLLIMVGCKDDDDPEPEAVSITLTLESATLDGSTIDPVPDYTLVVTFDKDGNPDGYTASGSATYQPSIGTSGTFSINSTVVTFTSGDDTRSVTITGGTLTNETTSVSLQWELTKIDDEVSADDAGTYVYNMTTN